MLSRLVNWKENFKYHGNKNTKIGHCSKYVSFSYQGDQTYQSQRYDQSFKEQGEIMDYWIEYIRSIHPVGDYD
jgi:hypothetical protein